MRIIHTTSGLGHNGCCVPCALAAITGRSYEDINAWLIYRGYRSGNNRSTKDWKINKAEFGLTRIKDFDRLTINQFLATNPIGEFYVLVSGHALTIKNAIAYDTIDSTKRKIQQLWLRQNWTLPHDFEVVAQNAKAMKDHKEKMVKQLEKNKVRDKQLKVKRKIDAQKRKQLKKSDDFKIQSIQNRIDKWEKKQKAATNALRKLNQKLKYYQRKKEKATSSVA